MKNLLIIVGYLKWKKTDIIALDSLLEKRISTRTICRKYWHFFPIAYTICLRTMISIAVQKQYNIIRMDIRAAYLNGDIKLRVYMKQPNGADDSNSKVCKLCKAIYGLPESSRCWYENFDNFMWKFGYQWSMFNPSYILITIFWWGQLY